MEGRRKILVVDDDDAVRDMIVEYLESHRFDALAAADSHAMRETLKEQRVDLVLLDRTMPCGDGLRLVPEVRHGHNVPVILVTALTADEERIRGLEEGADDYITKPFNWRELVARIECVIRRAAVARHPVARGNGNGGDSTEAFGRRTAAVLCADVHGYVRMMADDEEETLRSWWIHRATVIDPAVAHRCGRMAKLTGDGFIAEFLCVEEALRCAIEIQEGVERQNARLASERHMRFRIGINWCSFVADCEDIYGKGVNLAARLQSVAEPGGICVSDAALARIEGLQNVAFEAIAPLSLRGIAEPVQAFTVHWTYQHGAG